MKKFLCLLGLVALAAAPLSAGSIGVGYSSWDTDTADDDQGATIRVEVDVAPNVDFELRGSFFDSFRQASGGVLFEIEATPIDVGFNYDFIPGSKVRPYVAAGLTMLLISPNDQDTIFQPPSRPRSQEELGWYGGVGVTFYAAPAFSIYAEALYRDASGEVRGRDMTSQPQVDFEVDFGGASGSVGVAFTW